MIETILNIPVLFFVFGVIAVFLGSNLEIPKGMMDGITLYLMLAIGVKGGINLANEAITWNSFAPVLVVLVGSIIVATYMFYIARTVVSAPTAGGIAATYGSNSTMTFVTAASFLAAIDIAFGGYMTVALVLMETPAIIYAIYLASKTQTGNIWHSLKGALTDGTHLLLVASLYIGFLTVRFTPNTEILYGFIRGDIFTGALCFFLLAMGLKVGHSLRENIRENINWHLASMAVIFPWINGGLGFVAGWFLGFPPGDLFLTTILMGSASYIVAPAILSRALPEAEIAKYLTMSIAISFPMTLLIGMPVWWAIIG